MHTYSIRAAVTKTTGHYRRPGTMTTYCTGAPTDLHANTGKARRVCARCAKAEARDRSEAAAVAEEHREDLTATPEATQTWRSDWISATATAPTLFNLTGPREQGALFA
ncbi:hypothetical protein QEN62_gp55 [Streptomyces phage AxeJC]|uniref:Uncharacterized protein n=2 Tax=Ignaciovirus TaxID=3152509 RepID=A0A7D5JRT0_9CAUD|nr:hypothetical protein QEN61_gp55 [Streptomyces phage Eklok]YP_010756291.1 hypothetical protein QEN62_gp55 [Streptomyces phage AxeJC]QLF83239.1 hypothetical protein SEA_EKLOK_55 [Streptomyces phage Eklok]URC17977.1 hypothetical protein SEA_AXEJC_55 [Streptomyces phage AxeJC]